MPKPSTYYRFDPTNTAAHTLADLGRIGIEMRAEIGFPTWTPDACGELWKEIGRVTFRIGDGLIELWPFKAATSEDRAVLRGAGVDAFLTTPSRGTSWARRRNAQTGDWWECVLSIPAIHADLHVRVIRAASRRQHSQDRQFVAHYNTTAAAPERFGSAA